MSEKDVGTEEGADSTDRAELETLRSENRELRTVLREKEDQLRWYTQKFKESLLSLHVLSDKEKKLQQRENELWSEKHQLEHQYNTVLNLNQILTREYNDLGSELTRLRKYNPERLPAILKVPVKTLVVSLADGPLEPIRVALKKKRQNGDASKP